jgi:predicted ATPase
MFLLVTFLSLLGAPEAGETPRPSGTALALMAEPALFVGRAAERRRLGEQLAAACEGAPRIVFIEGETGMGKTALLNAFLARQAGGALRIATAQCIEQQGKHEPYMPVFEALDRLARALEIAASNVPLVLVIEDLHWADPATLDLLGALARLSRTCPSSSAHVAGCAPWVSLSPEIHTT